MKLLIVDDEILSLKLMEKIVDWDSLGIELIGMAQDGVEALKIFKKNDPQILITDIKMPRMDGLELIDHIRQINRQTKIIILSAYSEFEYAKKALSQDVIGYLLKPIDEEELIALTYKAIDEINEERKNFQSKKIASTSLLKQLLYPKKDIKHIIETMERLDMKFSFGSYVMLNIRIDSSSYYEYLKLNDINNIYALSIEEFIRDSLLELGIEQCVFFENNPGEWILILNHISSLSFVNDMCSIIEIAQNILNRLNQELKTNILITISENYSDIKTLSTAYNETINLAKYRFYFDNNSILYRGCIQKGFNLEEIKSNDQIKLYARYLETGQGGLAEGIIDEVFDNLNNCPKMDPEDVYIFCLEMLFAVKHELLNSEIEIDEICELKELSESTLKEMQTIDELYRFMKTTTKNIASEVLKTSKGAPMTNNKLIKKAIEYIHTNYNCNITLDEICEHVCISKNYFSYLFKREMNEGIWDYLTRVRVEKAKEFLDNTDLKAYEISYKVGYENPSYFSKMFKKLTGFTPQEYRTTNFD